MNAPSKRPRSLPRVSSLALASALALLGAGGCVSGPEHEKLAAELRSTELESMRRAGEIAALRQLLLYYMNAQPQAANQAAVMQLARAYSELALRYGVLSSDIEDLKRREADRRPQDEAGVRPTPAAAHASATPRRPPAPERAHDAPIDPFMDR